MDLLISFFRDTLDGWLYYVTLVFNVIFIFAIIGYVSEQKTKILLEGSKQFDEINRETLAVSKKESNEIKEKEEQKQSPSQMPQQPLTPNVQTQPVENKNETDTNEHPKTLSETIVTEQEQIPAVLDLDSISNSKE